MSKPTHIADVIASLAQPTPRLAVEAVQSTEAVDFDAWARRYVAALLEAEGIHVPATWREAA